MQCGPSENSAPRSKWISLHGSARPGLGHPPEVLVVARLDVAPAGHPLRGQADLVAPDVPGDLVVLVRRRREPVRRGCPSSTVRQLPGPMDRLTLEVVAEAPVAEHLEQGVMARRPADLLEVVVLAGDPQAALVVDRPLVAPRLGPGEDLLELDHPGVREQQGLVAGRDEAGRLDTTSWPRSAKNATNRRRISAAGRALIRGSWSGSVAASAVTVPNPASRPGPGRRFAELSRDERARFGRVRPSRAGA